MDQVRQQLFAPLLATFQALPLTLTDFLETVAEFCKADPVVAHAFCKHACDFMSSQPDGEYQINALVAETYRRTFFDPETAAKYGTDAPFRDLAVLKAFSEYLTTSFAMDKVKADSGNFQDSPTNQH